MTSEADSQIQYLQETITPILPQDSIAEAGRKILLRNFIQVLEHEAGSRTGDDIEDVHRMRVASRRMRSILSLLSDYYTPKSVKTLNKQLKNLAYLLGAVRDTDVMLVDIQQVKEKASDENKPSFDPLIKKLNKQNKKARKKLIKYLDSKDYAKLIAKASKLLTTEGKGVVELDEFRPYQVRHVLPLLINEALFAVRAYDNHIPSTDQLRDLPESEDESALLAIDRETLHALRIEVKRLRYIITGFQEVLGKTAGDFIAETKILQDQLGRMNDLTLLEHYLAPQDIDVDSYLDSIRAENTRLEQEFPAVWERFNTRTVQSKLSNALLALR